MLGPIRWVAWAVLRVLMSLRYKVTVVGAGAVTARPGPYLIMPNHPAYTDPPNLIVRLWALFRVRPLFLESNFRSPLFAPLAWLLRGIRMPDIVRASAEDKRRAEGAVGEVIAALRAGDNVILWPSGRLTRDGSERLGGARTAADVLAAVPNCTVVLARTRGLWGSMFSWADGKPSLMSAFFRGLGLWAANLFLFAPRRRVTVTLEAFGPDQRPQPTREAINKWLEAWFNADVPREEPTFVPRHILFGPRTHTFPPPVVEGQAYDLSKVKPETRAAVAQFVEDKIKRPLGADENAAETTFLQLGMDSLDAMETSLAVEQRFGFSSDTVPTTIGGLWAIAEGLTQNAPPKPPPPGWFDPVDAEPLAVLGETISAAFLNQALARRKMVIAADDLAGGVTYEKLVVGAWAMSAKFRAVAAPNVGLMLPASVACDLAFLGLHLAGKLPVMLNWTTGPGNLAHAVKLMGLTHVVTSKAFVDRVHVAIPGVQFLFLEDVKAGLGKFGLLRKLLSVRWFGGATRAALLKGTEGDPHKPAVVLFTSGSEKAPKAVPLTHANIIADQRGCLDALKLGRDNSALGFLPMFHSFGLTITSMLPLLVGVRVVHHPDPTDSAALVRKIAAYRPTLLAGTPTFIAYILERAKPADLTSVRLVVVGAEKAPPALFDKVKQLAPTAEVIEGYGITECAPVVAVTRPGEPVKPNGIGRPIAGVTVCVTDLETNAPLPQGQMGMLHVNGPTVFPGYIGHDGPPPFADLGGKSWYVTGDLAALDPDGSIVFHGRLKRFLKAGGEMISLPALEEPFAKKFPPTDAGPRVAVEGVETPDGRRIVLFTTEAISVREANALLQAEGHRGVMRLDDVKQVEKIPTLGTGKTDYKVLRAQIVEGK